MNSMYKCEVERTVNSKTCGRSLSSMKDLDRLDFIMLFSSGKINEDIPDAAGMKLKSHSPLDRLHKLVF